MEIVFLLLIVAVVISLIAKVLGLSSGRRGRGGSSFHSSTHIHHLDAHHHHSHHHSGCDHGGSGSDGGGCGGGGGGGD